MASQTLNSEDTTNTATTIATAITSVFKKGRGNIHDVRSDGISMLIKVIFITFVYQITNAA